MKQTDISDKKQKETLKKDKSKKKSGKVVPMSMQPDSSDALQNAVSETDEFQHASFSFAGNEMKQSFVDEDETNFEDKLLQYKK